MRFGKMLIPALWLLGALLSCPAYSATEYVYVSSFPGFGTVPDKAIEEGIYAARFDTETGHLSMIGFQVGLKRASWLVANPAESVIYAVASPGGVKQNSQVVSLKVDSASGKLRELNRVSSAGRDATYLYLDSASHTLAVANHGSGNLTVIPIRPDGSLGPVSASQTDYGTGPNPRQKMPQPHAVVMDPTGHHLLVSDFGADRLFIYRFEPASRSLAPASTSFVSVPPGSGPRHLVFTLDGQFVFVNTELTAEIHGFRWDAQKALLQPIQTLEMYPRSYNQQLRHRSSSSELAIAKDGRFLYAGLRGSEHSLLVYQVDTGNGRLREIQRVPSGGDNPWSFAIDPSGRWMLVGNQESDVVSVFRIDPANGKLNATSQALALPSPMAVTYYQP